MGTFAGDDLINDTAWLVDKCRRLAVEADDPLHLGVLRPATAPGEG